MSPDITLGEVKARCEEMFAKYGDGCCDHCEYTNLGCCDAPESWNVDAAECRTGRPNWEEMFKASEEACRQMCMKLESAEKEIDFLAAENERQRIMINTIETMIGREFDV